MAIINTNVLFIRIKSVANCSLKQGKKITNFIFWYLECNKYSKATQSLVKSIDSVWRPNQKEYVSTQRTYSVLQAKVIVKVLDWCKRLEKPQKAWKRVSEHRRVLPVYQFKIRTNWTSHHRIIAKTYLIFELLNQFFFLYLCIKICQKKSDFFEV